jgi:hypothetical protein
MLKGSATSGGTAAYRGAQGADAADGHFREWRGLSLASVGIGTYLGPDDDATDALYEAAVELAIASGINVVDSAVNYRGQRSERAVGRVSAASWVAAVWRARPLWSRPRAASSLSTGPRRRGC